MGGGYQEKEGRRPFHPFRQKSGHPALTEEELSILKTGL